MTRLLINPLMTLVITITTVLGCGVMPPGQASTRRFTVTAFTLPVSMVYAIEPEIPVRVPGIAVSKEAANAFVSRLVMQTVFDVLERHGRSAGLPDAIILAILGQVTVQITYEPLGCKAVGDEKALASADGIPANEGLHPNCIIIGNTVTSLCVKMGNGPREMCIAGMDKNIESIPSKHLSISGTLTTTNVIMANWSKEMWQSVVNRAVRMLASGPFQSHFFTAVAVVS
ncbi:hypothetical protein KIN20_025788 [Parelaphostrongylus tenuis]|uniref:Lipoprotein n=1 Tax=Parelaphostrongylus tenuis TaxID=148309 RepID=A0AAD5QXD9_PARTN|nr:hypothetical protein KIN20_025788 [Parelaphostrongylus tenuis]